MSDDLWFSRPDEGKAMVDSMKKRELLRLSVRWPLTIVAECRKPPNLRQEPIAIPGEGESPRL
jgi:hypothetical protein